MKKFFIYSILFSITFLSAYHVNMYILNNSQDSRQGYEERVVELSSEEKNIEKTQNDIYETIYLAGGCFWCIEGAFDTKDGIIYAVSGYVGGRPETAKYENIVTGKTAHREAVKVSYDPSKLTLQDILDTYLIYIDPYDNGGQFADRGYQYTTAIYYIDQEQKTEIQTYINNMEKKKELATKILKIEAFFEAEEEHQDYAQKQSGNYDRYFEGSGRKDHVESNKG